MAVVTEVSQRPPGDACSGLDEQDGQVPMALEYVSTASARSGLGVGRFILIQKAGVVGVAPTGFLRCRSIDKREENVMIANCSRWPPEQSRISDVPSLGSGAEAEYGYRSIPSFGLTTYQPATEQSCESGDQMPRECAPYVIVIENGNIRIPSRASATCRVPSSQLDSVTGLSNDTGVFQSDYRDEADSGGSRISD